MGLFTKVAGAWQEIGADGASGVPWAAVSGGTVTEYTKADGAVMEVHTFTANGTLTVDSPGYAEVLLVSGGAGSNNTAGGGAGGDILSGLRSLPSGSHAVTVGAGGTSGGNMEISMGQRSLIGSVLATVFAGYTDIGSGATSAVDGAAKYTGYSSSISGTSRTYGKADAGASGASTSGRGDGRRSGNGTAGVVIVAVQKSAPTVSGVVATGGTITTYTGDGTNGVLGQNYKVHTFTANGTLQVAQGGECDVLVVGGGGSGGQSFSDSLNSGSGGGGGVSQATITLPAASISVVVGAGVSNGATSNPSRLAGILLSDGGFGGAYANNSDSTTGAASGEPTRNAGGNRVADGGNGYGGGAGGAGANGAAGAGITSYISGSAVEYGKGGVPRTAATGVGQGGGGTPNAGTYLSFRGVVIVRYKV